MLFSQHGVADAPYLALGAVQVVTPAANARH